MNRSVFKKLNEFRLKGALCDVVLKVGHLEIKAHKIILSVRSPYFRALFTHGWSNPKDSVYTINIIPPDDIDLVINYIYMCDINITAENIEGLFRAANILGMQDFVNCCCEYIEMQLNPNICISVSKFAEFHGCMELHERTYAYLLEHFEEIVEGPSDEFLNLNPQDLRSILGQDKLNVRHEKTVFESIIKWVQHDLTNRIKYIDTLLAKVRLGLIDLDYMSNNMMENYPQFSSNINRAVGAFINLNGNTLEDVYFRSILRRPRLPHNLMFAIGGWSRHPSSALEVYDSRADSWALCVSAEGSPRAYHGTVFLDGFVYVIGGFDGMDYFNSVQKFNPVTQTWHQVAPMYSCRCYVSVATLDGIIYALGGFDGTVRLNTGECYEPRTNQWSPIMPMHNQRSDASATTLNRMIYICGGFNGNECLFSAECFNPDANQWTLISPMQTPRSGVGVVAFGKQLFAIGGFDGDNRLQCGEAYDPLNNSWRTIALMSSPRSNFGIEAMDGYVYAVGGYNGHSTTSQCEFYDPVKNEWYDMKEMNVVRSAVSCCVISGLPNILDYTFRSDTESTGHSEEEMLSSDDSSDDQSTESTM